MWSDQLKKELFLQLPLCNKNIPLQATFKSMKIFSSVREAEKNLFLMDVSLRRQGGKGRSIREKIYMFLFVGHFVREGGS